MPFRRAEFYLTAAVGRRGLGRGGCVSRGPVTVTSVQVVTVPGLGIWQAPGNLLGTVKVEGWGAGGRSLVNATNSRGGGGGGAYARLDAFAAVAGVQYGYFVPAETDDLPAIFGNMTELSASSGSNSGAVAAGGAGGLAATSVGDAVFNGGAGGLGTAAGDGGGGGGGSATSTGDGTIGTAGSLGGAGGAGEGAGGQGGTAIATPGGAGVAPGGGAGGPNRGAAVSGEGAAGRLVITYSTLG